MIGVGCVYSPEVQVFPAKDGSVCERPELDADLRLDCRSGFGTACFVTGAFGFAAAAESAEQTQEVLFHSCREQFHLPPAEAVVLQMIVRVVVEPHDSD